LKTRLFCASLLGTSLIASPAFAQDSDAMQITSQVPAFCSEFQNNATPLELGSLTGPTGQIVPSFTGTETSRTIAASFYCNAPANVTIKAEPLLTTNSTTDTSSFTSRVDYTATLVWDNVQGSVSSTVIDGAVIPASEANIGPMSLALSNPAVVNNRRPVAGAYSGRVTLTVALAQ